jgi:hypothetical protein
MTEVISKSELTRRQALPGDHADHVPPEMEHVDLTYRDGKASIVVYEGGAEHFEFTDFVTNEPMEPVAAYLKAIDAAERFAVKMVVIPDGHPTE